jgi:hypothetical protein
MAASLSGDNLCIPDTSRNAFVCIAAFRLLQRNIWGSDIALFGFPIDSPVVGNEKAAGFGGLLSVLGVFAHLLRRLLARRVEGAGVVDLGDLVVREAEHLAQDLVGVLAEQRRAGDLAR